MSRRYPYPLGRRSGAVVGLLVLLLAGGTLVLVGDVSRHLLADRVVGTVVQVEPSRCDPGRFSPSYPCWRAHEVAYEDGRVVSGVRGAPTAVRAEDLLGRRVRLTDPAGASPATVDEVAALSFFAALGVLLSGLLLRWTARRVPALQQRERRRRRLEGMVKRRATLARRAGAPPQAPAPEGRRPVAR